MVWFIYRIMRDDVTSSLIMWISGCQEGYFVFILWLFPKRTFFDILTGMEKFRKLKKTKRKRKHGFLSRMETHGGQKVLKRRREKKRNKLAL